MSFWMNQFCHKNLVSTSHPHIQRYLFLQLLPFLNFYFTLHRYFHNTANAVIQKIHTYRWNISFFGSDRICIYCVYVMMISNGFIWFEDFRTPILKYCRYVCFIGSLALADVELNLDMDVYWFDHDNDM